MTDMLERVRLALKASLDDSLRGAGVDPKGWHMTDAAKAAIAAMREPTDEMIERVARALATADGKDPDKPAWIRYPGGESFGICWRDQYADKARAAIDAALGDKP